MIRSEVINQWKDQKAFESNQNFKHTHSRTIKGPLTQSFQPPLMAFIITWSHSDIMKMLQLLCGSELMKALKVPERSGKIHQVSKWGLSELIPAGSVYKPVTTATGLHQCSSSSSSSSSLKVETLRVEIKDGRLLLQKPAEINIHLFDLKEREEESKVRQFVVCSKAQTRIDPQKINQLIW